MKSRLTGRPFRQDNSGTDAVSRWNRCMSGVDIPGVVRIACEIPERQLASLMLFQCAAPEADEQDLEEVFWSSAIVKVEEVVPVVRKLKTSFPPANVSGSGPIPTQERPSSGRLPSRDPPMPIYDCSALCNSVLLLSCAVSLLPLRDDCTSPAPARTTTLLALSTSHTAAVARSVHSATGTASQFISPGRLRSTRRIARVQP